MSIFESLENLNVSEECFDEIISIIEEIIEEGRQEGESIEDYKERLTQKYVPQLKAQRRHLNRKQKDHKKDFENAKKEEAEASTELESVRKNIDKLRQKGQKHWQDYEDSKRGSNLSLELLDKYAKTGQKLSKEYDKESNMMDKTRSAFHKQSNIKDKAWDDSRRAAKIADKVSGLTRNYGLGGAKEPYKMKYNK